MNAEMYRTISRDYEIKRFQANHDYELAVAELYNNNAELKAIDSEITSLGIQTAKLSIVSKEQNANKISANLKKIDEMLIGKRDKKKEKKKKKRNQKQIIIN
jgi:hypothetical protein